MTHPYWVAFSSIVTKEVRRFLRIWPQTLLPPAITMVLYFVIFGNLIGNDEIVVYGTGEATASFGSPP